MMEYKRLTERENISTFGYILKDHKVKVGEFGDYDAFFDYSMAVKRLGELEDKIEQGTLIELPFNVEKNLYYVNASDIETGNYGYIGIGKADIVHFQRNREGKYVFGFRAFFDAVGEEWYFLEDIGKTVFLTREEAEKRLKELQNG